MSNPWKPGQSGNPKGRPPKGRGLTDVLAREINKVVSTTGGERISGKRLLARAVVEGLTTGRIVLPVAAEHEPGIVSARVYEVKGDGWFDLLKWLYTQIDGAPRQAHEVMGEGGGPIVVKAIDYRTAIAPLAPGSMEDSDSSG